MINKIITLVSIFLLIMACNNPKVITAENAKSEESGSTGIFSGEGSASNSSSSTLSQSGMHQVIVEEVLPTSKYIYLHVTEGEEKFWIATGKQDVSVGQTIFYKGGLLKTNFESKEYNRTFDKVYLVSRIVSAGHGNEAIKSEENMDKEEEKLSEQSDSSPRNIEIKGSIKIAEIVANPQNYEGQTIQVSGECVKINYNIMGKNWIHLKDGTQDDYDFVITSSTQIPEGHVVTMKGKVVLNKDFGAGYRYDLILEEGSIVQ